jgi:hypothetical protein
MFDNFDNFVEGDVIKHHYGPYAFHFESIKARPADSFVISNKCRVLKIEGKTKEFLSFKEYCLKDERGNFINLYEFPMKAHLLKIFVCDTHEQDEEGDNIIMPIADCSDVVKCVSLNYEKSLVFFPLLHNLYDFIFEPFFYNSQQLIVLKLLSLRYGLLSVTIFP